MLRPIIFALALALPSLAYAEPTQDQFPQSAVGAEVRGHDGTVLGRVTSVERNARGEIVAAEVPGLEPEDAPPQAMLVADTRSNRTIIGRGGGRETRPSILRASTATIRN
jgi:hypothetical protein